MDILIQYLWLVKAGFTGTNVLDIYFRTWLLKSFSSKWAVTYALKAKTLVQ